MLGIRGLKRALLPRCSAPSKGVEAKRSAAALPEAERAPAGSHLEVLDRLRSHVAALSEGKLSLDAIGPTAGILDYGYVDSLSAVSLLAFIEEQYGVSISEVDLVVRLPSLDALARHVYREANREAAR